MLGLGLLLALHWTLFFEALKRASVAVAILTVYTAPIFLAVLAPLLLAERRSRIGMVALTVSAPGLVLIALSGEGGSRADPVAVLMGLGAAITYALLVMATKTVVRDVSPFAVGFWTYATVSVAIVPFALGSGRFLPHGSEWRSVLALGALLTALSGVIYIRALRDVTGQAAGPLATSSPCRLRSTPGRSWDRSSAGRSRSAGRRCSPAGAGRPLRARRGGSPGGGPGRS